MQKNEDDIAVTADDIQKITLRLDDFEERLKKLESLIDAKPLPSRRVTSVREFLIERQPKSDVEKALIIGYYLEQNRNLESFNAKDLSDGFREAKESVPTNVNLAVIGNIQKGYFMEAKEKKGGLKAWTLTNSGISYLENPDVVEGAR